MAVKRRLGYDKVQKRIWAERNPYRNTEFEWSYEFTKGAPFIGIVLDVAFEHQYYINACRDLQMNYKVLDIRTPDWIQKIRESDCVAFLIWPTIYKPIQKQFWDERLYTMKFFLGLKVFPSPDILWIYESKRKTLDWLVANNLPHPKTFVFYDIDHAAQFAAETELPIVCKTDQGAAASGVFIIRSRQEAMRMVRKAFSEGLLLKNRGLHDRHQGYIIFQEYLEDCKEWRIIRVGESYFCRYKIKVGDFHSGSGDIVWAKPPQHLLDTTKILSNNFEIPNINIDYFETKESKFLINEVHALWGGKVLKDEELEGRYLFNETSQRWSFEQGDFFQNRCANLRLEWVKKHWMSK